MSDSTPVPSGEQPVEQPVEQPREDGRQPVKGIFSAQEIRKVGTGTTQRKIIQKTYWHALELQNGDIELQVLNPNYIPAGPKKIVPLDQFLEKLKVFGSTSDIIVLGGRLPNGADVDYYKHCIESLCDHPVKVIIDADGESLKRAITAKPFLIKPNAYELGMLFDEQVHTVEDAVALSRKITDRGVQIVCCSLGELGAVIVDSDSAWFSPAVSIEPKGYQGAGDSMVAGICKAMTEDLPLSEMLRYGTAAAAASLIREGTLLCQKSDFDLFLKDVRVNEVYP